MESSQPSRGRTIGFPRPHPRRHRQRAQQQQQQQQQQLEMSPTLRSLNNSRPRHLLANPDRAVLPPLPAQGPPPLGRSSSPRNHSSWPGPHYGITRGVPPSSSHQHRVGIRTTTRQGQAGSPPPPSQALGRPLHLPTLPDFATRREQQQQQSPASSPLCIRPLFSDSSTDATTTTLPNNILSETTAMPSQPDQKRRRASFRQPELFPAAENLDDSDDSLFGESPLLPDTMDKVGEYTTIDLTGATDVPEELKVPEKDNRVKLSKFQCVICMDNANSLVVTHCGHMFCAKCLHSSLHIDSTRGRCPMCRSKIDMKPRNSYNTKTKGYWPLEMKLMTATRKGKRKLN